jgi:hypothetical protein
MSTSLEASSFFIPVAAETIFTACPRLAISSETRSTNSLIDLPAVRWEGLTWTIERGSADTNQEHKGLPQGGFKPTEPLAERFSDFNHCVTASDQVSACSTTIGLLSTNLGLAQAPGYASALASAD